MTKCIQVLALALVVACGSSGRNGGVPPPPPPENPARHPSVLDLAMDATILAVARGALYYTTTGEYRKVNLPSSAPEPFAQRGELPAPAFWRGGALYVVDPKLGSLSRITPGEWRWTYLATSGSAFPADPVPVAEGVVWSEKVSTSPDLYSAVLVSDDGVTTTFATSSAVIGAVAADATHAYWVETTSSPSTGYAIRRAPLVGGAAADVVSVAGGALATLPLAAADGVVYFGHQGQLVRVAGDGTGLTIVSDLAPPHGAVSRVLIAGPDVFWYDGYDLHATPLAGDAPPHVVAAPGFTVLDLLVHDGTVYLGGRDGDTTRGNGVVASVSIAGGAITTLRSGVDWPGGLATDGTSLYFGDGAGYAWDDGCPSVVRMPLAGGDVVPFANALAGVAAAAAGADDLFVLDGTRLKAVPLAGGIPRELFQTPGMFKENLAGLAVGAEAVFVVERKGRVTRVPLDGSPPAVLVSPTCADAGPIRLAGDHLYWWCTSGSGWEVRRATLDGSGVETVFTSTDAPVLEDMVVGGGFVFLGLPGVSLSRLVRIPVTGGDAVEIATSLDGPVRLTIDGDTLYVAEGGYTWPKYSISSAMFTPYVRLDDIYCPNTIAVDTDHVYWADGCYGALLSATPK